MTTSEERANAALKELIKSTSSLEECLSGAQEINELKARASELYPLYISLCSALKDVHETAELGALICSVREMINRVIDDVESGDCSESLQAALNDDPILVLNSHGKDHVDLVLKRARDLLYFCDPFPFTLDDLFMLMCSIQIHDIGVVKGRENHEKNCSAVLKEQNPSGFDVLQRKIMCKIAAAHSGKASDGSRDTISQLEAGRSNGYLFREIAALVRFADELADDKSRANPYAVDHDVISTYSELYHRYSLALNRVSLVPDPNSNRRRHVKLEFYFDVETAKVVFPTYGGERYLLDEIHVRTLKMEQERRYCFQFLRDYIDVSAIDVNIKVGEQDYLYDDLDNHYLLDDSGYPDLNSKKCGYSDPVFCDGETLANRLEEGAVDGD